MLIFFVCVCIIIDKKRVVLDRFPTKVIVDSLDPVNLFANIFVNFFDSFLLQKDVIVGKYLVFNKPLFRSHPFGSN